MATDSRLSIKGTYRLVKRERPDGTVLRPPEILGVHTFTDDLRNFNVRWVENGTTFQVAVAAKYKLTEKEYTETSLYHMNHNLKQQGAAYENTGETASSPVKVKKNGRVEIVFPFNQPKYIFTKNGYRVVAGPLGTFFWRKVSD